MNIITISISISITIILSEHLYSVLL